MLVAVGNRDPEMADLAKLGSISTKDREERNAYIATVTERPGTGATIFLRALL